MARITDTLLVQRVEDTIVMVDETGAIQEVTFPLAAVPNVIAALGYLYDPDDPDRAAREWHDARSSGKGV